MRLGLTVCGALTGAVLLAGVAGAQDEKKEAAAVELRVKGAKGDAWKFERRRARKVVCPQMSTDSEQEIVEPYTVTVLSAGERGRLDLEVEFGTITGSLKAQDGSTLAFDSSKDLPAGAPLDELQMRVFTAHASSKIKVTVDARGKVTAVSGYREAAVKALKGTPFDGFAQKMSDAEQVKEMQPYLPPLPGEDLAPGATWKDEKQLDFGARRQFGYERTWSVTPPADGAVAVTAKLEHVPGDSVPEGQTNAGKGETSDSRSAKDGLLLERTTKASFEGKGNFDVEAEYSETIERKQ